MATCNSLYIDIAGLEYAIEESCLEMLNDVADKLQEAFEKELINAGAGRTDWRKNAAKEFKKLSEEITLDMVQVTLGLNPSIPSDAWHNNKAAQIMVALFGNHPPIETKPNLVTFHDHMESRRRSEATTVRELPQYSWPDPGADAMLDNAFQLTKKYFKDGLKDIAKNIRFADYVHVMGGS